ncbi:MAG: hypothetical protein JRJ70_13685 [Deltaproteobacteria bacterium]|nr:hypothetical protein [Deltaproteobacteria bacterium]
MAQGQRAEARAPAGALDEAAVVAGWAAVVSVWAGNAYAPIVAIGLPIREARPAPSFGVQNADHRWGGKY